MEYLMSEIIRRLQFHLACSCTIFVRWVLLGLVGRLPNGGGPSKKLTLETREHKRPFLASFARLIQSRPPSQPARLLVAYRWLHEPYICNTNAVAIACMRCRGRFSHVIRNARELSNNQTVWLPKPTSVKLMELYSNT
jgi:hypothetical protein